MAHPCSIGSERMKTDVLCFPRITGLTVLILGLGRKALGYLVFGNYFHGHGNIPSVTRKPVTKVTLYERTEVVFIFNSGSL